MKKEYDISKMKRKGHPLRDRVVRGELKLIDPRSASPEELRVKLSAYNFEVQEPINTELVMAGEE